MEALAAYHSWLWALPEPRGVQRPRIHVPPPRVDHTWGPEAVEIAAAAGLLLDPWQCFTLDDCMGRRDDGPEQWGGSQWAAFEFGQVVSRQNGKGGWLEARELHALYLGRERLIIHTAHKYDTSGEAYRRIKSLIDNTDELRREVARMSNSHGDEGIELRDGSRLLFKARSMGASRGFSSDLLIWDEAMYVTGDPVAAMLPTLSARVDPQVIYTGSAGFATSVAFGRLRRRCRKQAKMLAALAETGVPVPADAVERIAWHEYSCDEAAYRAGELVQGDFNPADPVQWAQGNPGMGYRIMVEIIRSEMGAMGRWSKEFAAERLGVGDWPTDEDEERWAVIGRDIWAGLHDPGSQDLLAEGRGQMGLGLEMSWDRSALSLGLVARRTDERYHVEIPRDADGREDYRSGDTGWAVPRVAEIVRRHKPAGGVAVNAKGPASVLIPDLRRAGVEVRELTYTELAQGFGLFWDLTVKGGPNRLAHLNDAPLNGALAGAATRKIGDGRTWDMKEATTDSAPLIAVTNALEALHTAPAASTFFASYR